MSRKHLQFSKEYQKKLFAAHEKSQCSGITKEGRQCKKMVSSPTGRCNHHFQYTN